MVLFSIITAFVVYYLMVWGWYNRLKRQPPAAQKQSQPRPDVGSLIGATRFRSGLICTSTDSCGHFPQAVENETTFAPELPEEPEELAFEMTFDEPEEPDMEDEEIASYLMDDEAGQATGVEFDKLGEAVRTANNADASEADKQQAADTLNRIAGTNLYDAVVANINGGMQQVAELLKRNEAALLVTQPSAATGDRELDAFDMNDFL
ncbi:hypothetical protein [Bacteroides sp.]|uniref:hypothetical protein n=1 Tax=Bacteroides sp. TaxID=29523 RepID=UPI0026088685|nr:hypothetical protein [Bacteroides sp.]MDD3039276.1 hypothetical protein [Bacteroides sp.]